MGVFEDLNRGRQMEALRKAIATNPFVVRSLTKKGAIAKSKLYAGDYFPTFAAAWTRVGQLEAMNPGTKFVVTDHDSNVITKDQT